MEMKILRLDRDENHIVQEKEQVKITLQAIFRTGEIIMCKANENFRLSLGDKPKT